MHPDFLLHPHQVDSWSLKRQQKMYKVTSGKPTPHLWLHQSIIL